MLPLQPQRMAINVLIPILPIPGILLLEEGCSDADFTIVETGACKLETNVILLTDLMLGLKTDKLFATEIC